MRLRRPRESRTDSFVGRIPSEIDERAFVVGYFSELARQHVLNDLFIEQVLGVIEDVAKANLALGLYELCADGISNEGLRKDAEKWVNGGETRRPPESSVLEGLFYWAKESSNPKVAKKIRVLVLKSLADSGGKLPDVAKIASVKSFAMIKKIFGLNDDDLAILVFFYCAHSSEPLESVINSWRVSELYYGIASCIGLPEARCHARLSNQGPLVEKGIIMPSEQLSRSAISHTLSFDLYTYIAMGGEDNLAADFVSLVDEPTYPLESFPVESGLTDTVVDLLSHASGDSNQNILLYGKEGSGKTKFSRAVAAAAGKKLYEYKQDGYTGGGTNDDIFRILCAVSSLDGRDSILLIDEAEDLLATRSVGGFFAPPARTFQKARIHDVLDSTKCSIIWIVNRLDRMDASTKRRFAFSIEFEALSSSSIKTLARTCLEDIPMSAVLRDRLVTLSGNYGLTGASMQYLRDTVRSVLATGKDDGAILERIERLFESNARLLSGTVMRRPEIEDAYSLDALDTSVPPERLVELVRKALARIESEGSRSRDRRIGLRFLFHGASGTGKTEFARYIAKTVDRPLLVKRASDILDPYVGGSEQNVVRIFREAETSRSILLLDEADSFFFDRSTATRSWERTLVNEFLVQMEEFKGILVCSTNFATVLDSALARRFHETVEFRPLSRASFETLLSRYYPNIVFDDAHIADVLASGPVTPGDFGALKGRTDYLSPEEVSCEYVVESLCAMARAKTRSTSTPIGFSAG